MTTQFNNLPTYQVPLQERGYTQKDWYLWFANTHQGRAPAAVVPTTPGASPYTFTAPVKGFMLITGGTVSLVEFSRDGVTYYSYGTTSGQFQVNASDLIRVTYTVVPTMTFVPT